MSLYDIDTEEETIHIIRAQNKKIQNLYYELEQKQETIIKLKNDFEKIKDYEDDIEKLQRQNFTLNEKVKVLQKSLEEHHYKSNEHLLYAHEAENRIKLQFDNKETIILNLNETIQQFENQNNKIKNSNNDITKSILSLKNENEDLKMSIKNYLLKLKLNDEEIKMVKKDKDEIEKVFSVNKFQFGNKAEELVDLIKQQNSELSKMSNKIYKMEVENNNLLYNNNKYKNEISEIKLYSNELKSNLKCLEGMGNKVIENEKLILELNNSIESERKKNSELYVNLDNTKEQNNELLVKISEMDNLKQILLLKEEEIFSLNKQLDSCREFIKIKENCIKEIENDITNFVNYCNGNILTILKWADTYLGVYIDLNSNQSVLKIENNFENNLNTNKLASKLYNTNHIKFNLDSFSQILMKIQTRLNKDLQEYEETIYELKNDISNMNYKIEDLLSENSKLKDEKLSNEEERINILEMLNKNKQELDQFKGLYNNSEIKKKEIEKKYNCFFECLLKEFKIIHDNIKANPKLYDKAEFVFNNTLSENNVRIFFQ